MPENERFPTPLLNMSPSGLPGFFVLAFVVFGFAYLFVSENVARVLLLLMVAVIAAVSGVAVWRWLLARRARS